MSSAAAPVSNGRVTYRNTGIPKVLLFTGVALLGISWLVGSWLGAALIMGLWVAVSVLSYRVRVVADDDGVSVVNYLSTNKLRWSEISRVSDDGNTLGGPLCRFELRTGGQVRAWGLYGGDHGLGAESIQAAISDLENRRQQHPGPHHPHNPTHAQREAARRGQPDPRTTSVWVGFFLGGVLVLSFGLYLSNNAVAFNQFGVPTTGTVVSISTSRSADVTVAYVVDKVTLTNAAQEWEGTPIIGSTVALVYDRRDPTRVTDPSAAGTTGAFVEALSVVALGLGIIAAALRLRRLIQRTPHC